MSLPFSAFALTTPKERTAICVRKTITESLEMAVNVIYNVRVALYLKHCEHRALDLIEP